MCSPLSVRCALLFLFVGTSLLNPRWGFYYCSVVERVMFWIGRIYLGVAMKKCITLLLTSTCELFVWKKVIVLMSLFQKLHMHSYTTWLISSLNNVVICNDQHHFPYLDSESNPLLLLFCFFVIYCFMWSQHYKLSFCMSYLSINAGPTDSM